MEGVRLLLLYLHWRLYNYDYYDDHGQVLSDDGGLRGTVRRGRQGGISGASGLSTLLSRKGSGERIYLVYWRSGLLWTALILRICLRDRWYLCHGALLL